ncbi:MAG: hypothetical protein ABDI07_12230 [Candidatus Kryptonium sp.]
MFQSLTGTIQTEVLEYWEKTVKFQSLTGTIQTARRRLKELGILEFQSLTGTIQTELLKKDKLVAFLMFQSLTGSIQTKCELESV